MHLKVYNTKTRKKEQITYAPHQKELSLYTCGPTVYNFAHIGNLRTYVVEDLFRRTLEFFGFAVKQVMNLTDIDDKIIKRATEKGIPLEEFTKEYKKAFFEDLKTLKIQPAHETPSATEYISKMIEMIQKLIEKGIAYQAKEGSIYFSIQHFPAYGALSRLPLEDLKAAASNRLSNDEYEKEEVADFVLWKRYDPKRDGSIFWESPFGKGRPGWHIECSAMANALLGETVDIHMGGVDNIFPHHENEIAQSESLSGQPLSRFWLHIYHLIVDGKKMSKSLNNFYTLRDLLAKGYSGNEIRFLLISSHYRSRLNFTIDGLEAARRSLSRLEAFAYRLHDVSGASGDDACLSSLEKVRTQFQNGLADDLNISVALAALFDFVRLVNVEIDRKQVTERGAREILHFLEEANQVLGVIPMEAREEKLPSEIQVALEKRKAARAQKDWVEADKQRSYIESRGYEIEDAPRGPRLKKTSF